MRPNQNRGERLSPLAIRALGVLMMTLLAITSSTTGSAAVQACSDCPEEANSDCKLASCEAEDDAPCRPNEVPEICRECYTWQCTATKCTKANPDDGKRLECVLSVQT